MSADSNGMDSESKTGLIRKPPWLRVKAPHGEAFERLKRLMRGKSLNTVCEEARCPNLGECWGRGTATFLILGDVCTRNCGFCAVKKGSMKLPKPDADEPHRIADAVATMQLSHVVITSVTRDDLEDGGAEAFAAVIRTVREKAPTCTIEVLIPDFKGSHSALKTVLDAAPEVLGHNIETVPRLYPRVRPLADYERSLELIIMARKAGYRNLLKSGVMVGLGETWNELLKVIEDLSAAGCHIISIGQYLSPTPSHLPVERYYTPEEFDVLKEAACQAGIQWVESSPLVRSSYHADRPVQKLMARTR